MAHVTTTGKARAILLLGWAVPGLLALSGCRERSPELTVEEGALVARVAEPAAGALQRTLLGRLTAALDSGGPAHAVEFCSVDAVPLTRMVEAGLEGGLVLKRTSFRYRNPENAPDQAEELALRYFENALHDQGAAPTYYVQRVSGEEMRYYKPLFVAEFCLQCHGDPAAMDPEVRAKLDATYPGDLATGYEVGDFRGAVRVSVPAAMVEEGE